MSNFPYRSHEPLYLIIVKNPNASALLNKWAKNNNVSAQIEANRMKLYDHRSLTLFQINWEHNWNNVIIYDYWTRKHIHIN